MKKILLWCVMMFCLVSLVLIGLVIAEAVTGPVGNVNMTEELRYGYKVGFYMYYWDIGGIVSSGDLSCHQCTTRNC